MGRLMGLVVMVRTWMGWRGGDCSAKARFSKASLPLLRDLEPHRLTSPLKDSPPLARLPL
jgi:hypothetical protein